MLKRIAALEKARLYVGYHETEGNNAGDFVEAIQRSDSLPGEKYSWCQSFQNAMWRLATGGHWEYRKDGDRIIRWRIIGGEFLAGGTASVGVFVQWARERGYVVDRPFRGDHVTFYFDRDGWADHVGIVDKVLSLGLGFIVIRTIEGNTGPLGAVSDPGTGKDGVYLKRRLVKKGAGTYIRVKGSV